VTPVEAAIGEETPAEDQEPLTTASAPESSVAPETPAETTAEAPITSASDHTSTISGYNYTLSQSECSAQFPDLYKEIDRAVAVRKKMGNVTPSDIDTAWKPSGAVRAMIYNQKVNGKPTTTSN
jgi:hypothetical protein